MRSNVGQAKPQGERDSYRAEDRSRRLYAGGRSHAQFRRRKKGSLEEGAEPANSSEQPQQPLPTAGNHRSGAVLPLNKRNVRRGCGISLLG